MKKQRIKIILKYKLRHKRRRLHKWAERRKQVWRASFADTGRGVTLLVTLFVGVFSGIFLIESGLPKPLMFLAAAVSAMLIFTLLRLLAIPLFRLIYRLLGLAKPKDTVSLIFLFVLCVGMFSFLSFRTDSILGALIGVGIGIAEAFFAKCLWALVWKKRRTAPVLIGLVLTFAANGFLAFALFGNGFENHTIQEYRAYAEEILREAAPEESLPEKRYEVGSFCYDYEPEAPAVYSSSSIDLGSYVSFDGFTKWIRTLYWGYGIEQVPFAGKVWYPQGSEGEVFPMLFLIHGNHIMTAESHLGYAYLGEYLAASGYIVVSVDENFLNGYIDSGLGEENDARAVLLLENIKWMQGWAREENSPLHGIADFSRITLAGHSRGGEAAAIAALFNELDCYPDNGNIRFNYGFAINSVIAIAPSVDQYRPAGKTPMLEDINYLLVHGSNDGDVTNMMGMNQYESVQFSGTKDCFKTYLYIAGANHGQFNTEWGEYDQSEPMSWFLNTEDLLEEEEQQQILCVAVKNFMDATTAGSTAGRAFFQDSRNLYRMSRETGSAETPQEPTLPETIYISAYEDSSFVTVADFEEDSDLNTIYAENGTARASGFGFWREVSVYEENQLYAYEVNNHALQLWWEKADGLAAPQYELAFRGGCACEDKNYLQLEVQFIAPEAAEEEAFTLLDFTISLFDRSGAEYSCSVRDYCLLFPPIPVRISKEEYLSDEECLKQQFSTVRIPLEDFVYTNKQQERVPMKQTGTAEGAETPDIYKIRLTFDKTEKGEALIDNIGFSR